MPPNDAIASRKRKAIDGDISDDEDEDEPFTDNCNQVRRKIRAVLNAGEMKVGQLQKAMGVTSKSYLTFMAKNGPWEGANTATYPAAAIYFRRRERAGVKLPTKKVKKADEDKSNDVSGINLDGESDIAVQVYDSCDEVRKKITAHLRGSNVTQAGFLREIAKTYPEGKKIQSKSLNDFLGKKGPSAGNTSMIYYASYVFFEKLRIRDGKPKSSHREKMESVWRKQGGVDTKTLNNHYFCREGERPYEDEFGQVTIQRVGRPMGRF